MSIRVNHLVAGVLGALVAFATPAQQEPPPLDSTAAISTQQLRPGLHLLVGGGGNIAVWSGADGIVVVDSNLASLAPGVLAAVGRLSSAPIRFIINTHWHPDHTGGNELLGKSGAIIVAHERVRLRMSEEQFIELTGLRVPPSSYPALPNLSFVDSITLYLNGDRLEVQHLGDAHTDGDAVLWWQGANVVHTGDVYLSGTYPFFDRSSGGTLAGLVAAIEAVLARANDSTVIIPGHGPVSNRQELVEYRDMLVTVGRRVREAIEAGRSLEEVLESRPSGEFDLQYGQGYMTPARFVTMLYRDLATPTPGLRSPGRN